MTKLAFAIQPDELHSVASPPELEAASKLRQSEGFHEEEGLHLVSRSSSSSSSSWSSSDTSNSDDSRGLGAKPDSENGVGTSRAIGKGAKELSKSESKAKGKVNQPSNSISISSIGVLPTRARGGSARDRFVLVRNGDSRILSEISFKALTVSFGIRLTFLVRGNSVIFRLTDLTDYHISVDGSSATEVLVKILRLKGVAKDEDLFQHSKNGEFTLALSLTNRDEHYRLYQDFPELQDVYDRACEDFDNNIHLRPAHRPLDLFKAIFRKRFQDIFGPAPRSSFIPISLLEHADGFSKRRCLQSVDRAEEASLNNEVASTVEESPDSRTKFRRLEGLVAAAELSFDPTFVEFDGIEPQTASGFASGTEAKSAFAVTAPTENQMSSASILDVAHEKIPAQRCACENPDLLQVAKFKPPSAKINLDDVGSQTRRNAKYLSLSSQVILKSETRIVEIITSVVEYDTRV